MTRYPEVSRYSLRRFGRGGDRKGIQREQPRYIVPLAVNKTRQCSETVCDRVLPPESSGARARARVCADTTLCARPASHGRGAWEKARAFICLLAGPGINNAAIRYKNEKKGW